jgi:hypothetical protein
MCAYHAIVPTAKAVEPKAADREAKNGVRCFNPADVASLEAMRTCDTPFRNDERNATRTDEVIMCAIVTLDVSVRLCLSS